MTNKKTIKKKQLTDRQARFVELYLVYLNASKAALEAGFAKSTAEKKAPLWVGKSRDSCPANMRHVWDAVEQAKWERSERTKIDADYVLKKAVHIFETSMADFLVMPADGEMPYFDLSQATPEQLAAIDTLQLDTVKERDGTDDDGKPVMVTVRKIRMSLPKKKEMLELIGKHVSVQAFREQVGLGNPDGSPIDTEWRITVVDGGPIPEDP